ncbi:DUF2510 domain-containing protein [Propionibacteriaceae bacterium Y1685]
MGPGWYSDPAGGGGYRWWDGRAWTSDTTTTPGPAPRTASSGGSRRATPWGWIVGGLAVVLAVILAVAFLVNRSGGPRDITDDYPTASSTVSAWDDGSTPTPTPTPTPPGSESPSPRNTPSEGDGGSRPCPTASGTADTPPSNDGRLHGGGISVAEPGAGWEQSSFPAAVMFFASDLDGRSAPITGTWVNILGVGELTKSDGFADVQSAADSVTSCLASSGFMSATGREDEYSREHKVDGRQGWTVRSRVESSSASGVKGSYFDVIVVDVGRPDSLAVVALETTIDHHEQDAMRQRVLDSVRVDG